MREVISRKDAIAKGMNRYFTGKPCKHGHLAERSVIDHACVPCRNEIRRKTHIKNIEKDKARDAKYYQENKERLDEINKQWRKDNPDWDRDWSQGCAGVGEVGEWTDKLKQKYPGWNDVLKKAQKAPGSKIKTI